MHYKDFDVDAALEKVTAEPPYVSSFDDFDWFYTGPPSQYSPEEAGAIVKPVCPQCKSSTRYVRVWIPEAKALCRDDWHRSR